MWEICEKEIYVMRDIKKCLCHEGYKKMFM